MADEKALNPHCEECGVEGELLVECWEREEHRFYCLYCLALMSEARWRAVERGKREARFKKEVGKYGKEVSPGNISVGEN